MRIESNKLRALRALVLYLPRALRALVPHEPRALRDTVPKVPCVLPGLLPQMPRALLPLVPHVFRINPQSLENQHHDALAKCSSDTFILTISIHHIR